VLLLVLSICLAPTSNYVASVFIEFVHLQLEGARHPCVELQDDVNFIPNDFNLVFGSSSFLLVTGPNMGKCRLL
jgi:DNA mismatch repair ATPase MutS